MPHDLLRDELLAMAGEDERVRGELAAAGALSGGYHPVMEAVHRRNAERLSTLLEHYGWPGRRLVGDDGAEAAWRIAQHAIGEPAFMRRCHAALQVAAAAGDAPAWQPAMLEDRILMFEGRPQRYGTQLEHDDDGNVRPYLLDEPDAVEERRQSVGLEPLAERLAREPRRDPSPEDGQYQRDYQRWLRRTGWRAT